MTQRQSQVKLLSIHQFAKLCYTTPRTLRFYEQKGLFKPYQIDPFTKYRYYNPQQARDFLKIKLLQNFNLPLAHIRESITHKHIEDELKNRIIMVKKEIEEKEKEYDFLKAMNSFMFDQKNAIPLRTAWFGPYTLIAKKFKNADYVKIEEYKTQLLQELKQLKIQVDEKLFVFYETTQYEPKNTQLELAFICLSNKLPQADNVPKNIFYRSLPKTKALTYTYTGPFEYFSLVYQRLFAYIADKNIVLVDRVFDITASKRKTRYETSATLAFPIQQTN